MILKKLHFLLNNLPICVNKYIHHSWRKKCFGAKLPANFSLSPKLVEWKDLDYFWFIFCINSPPLYFIHHPDSTYLKHKLMNRLDLTWKIYAFCTRRKVLRSPYLEKTWRSLLQPALRFAPIFKHSSQIANNNDNCADLPPPSRICVVWLFLFLSV